jgi:hypothetical protein
MKNAILKNEYDGPLSRLNKIDRKYLRFVKEYNQPAGIAERVFEALK